MPRLVALLARLARPQFRLRTLFGMVALVAVVLWVILEFPHWHRAYQVRAARSRINQYERIVAGDGDPGRVPSELVAILGDSRMKHWGAVWQVENGLRDCLLSFGGDSRFRVWDVHSGEQTFVMRARQFACSVDGSKALLVDEQENILVWDVAAAKMSSTPSSGATVPIRGLAANYDGTIMAALVGEPKNMQVQVRNVATGEVVAAWPVFFTWEMRLSLSRDGKLLATINELDADVWNVATTKRVHKLPAVELARIYSVVFSADGSQAFTGNATGKLRCWDLASGKEAAPVREFPGTIRHIALDRRGRRMTVITQDSATFLELGAKLPLPSRQQSFAGHSLSACSREMEPQAFGHHDYPITLWRQGMPERLARSLDIDIACLAFMPDGKYLITGGRNGELALWHVGSWTLHKSWTGHTGAVQRLAASPGGSRFTSVSDDGNIVLWDVDRQQQVTTFPAPFRHAAVAFTPDGQQLAIADGQRRIQFHDVASGQTGPALAFSPRDGVRGEMAFTPDGKALVAGAPFYSVTVWDLERRAILRRIGPQSADDVRIAVSPDGTWMVSSLASKDFAAWDVATGEQRLTMSGHGAMVQSVAISSDGRWIASAARDGTARLWSARDGSLVHTFELCPPSGVVRQVAFSPDGSYLATANGNGTAYVLDLKGIKPAKQYADP